VKLVDTPDLGSGAERLKGSSPFSRIGSEIGPPHQVGKCCVGKRCILISVVRFGRDVFCESSSAVELHLAKVDVAGSNPVSRSLCIEAIRVFILSRLFFLLHIAVTFFILRGLRMNLETTVEKLPASAVKLTITIPQTDVKQSYDELISKYTKSAQVKGFRKGKVPRDILERKFGPALKGEALQELVESSLSEAFEKVEERPLPYARPALQEEDLELDLARELIFSVTYDVFPTVEPGEYTGLTVTEPKVKITKADEDKELEDLRQRNGLVIDKEDSPIEEGDMLTLTVSELDETETVIEGTRQESYQVVVGESNYYELDEELRGLKQGESKVIEKTYPEDHSEESLQGQTRKIGISVVAVKTRDLPDLDDDFAKDVNDEFETIADLRKDIRKQLEKTLAERVRGAKIEDLMNQISENTTLEVPQTMVNSELDSSWQGLSEQYRITPEQLEQLLQMQGKTREEIFEEWRPAATERLKKSLITQELIKREEITVSPEEAEEQIRQDAAERNTDADRVLEFYRSNNMLSHLQHELAERKLFDHLLEQSTIKPGKAIKYMDLIKENE